MSSDGRYMYHHSPGMPSPYEYPQYAHPQSQPPYDPASQMAQPHPRLGVRTNPAQSQSPTHPPSYPPQSPYQANYGHPNQQQYIAMPQQHPQQSVQWTNENWTNYNQQSFPPPSAPIPEATFSSDPGRPDAPPPPHPEQRTYQPQPQPSPDTRRPDERQNGNPPAPAPPPPHVEAASPLSPPPFLDFMKLLDPFREVIDASRAFNGGQPVRPTIPNLETLDRMLQSANRGRDMIYAVSAPPKPPSPPKVEVVDTKPNVNGSGNGAKHPEGATDENGGQEGQTCLGCEATATPEWRRGPFGPRTLCNACGLVYAKMIKRRIRERGQNGNAQGGSNAEEEAIISDMDGVSDDSEGFHGNAHDRPAEPSG